MKEAADRGNLAAISFPQAACLWEPRTGAGAENVDNYDVDLEVRYIANKYGSKKTF